jgi:hypothetical protein
LAGILPTKPPHQEDSRESGHKAIEKALGGSAKSDPKGLFYDLVSRLVIGSFIKCNVVQKIDHSPVGCGWSCFNLTIYEGNTVLLETYYRFQCKDAKNENDCRL